MSDYWDVGQFEGVTTGADRVLQKGLADAVSVAASLSRLVAPSRGPDYPATVRHAAQAAVLTANAMLAALWARCTISAPPEADIELRPDASGSLIYRCQHATPHEWSLDGRRLP